MQDRTEASELSVQVMSLALLQDRMMVAQGRGMVVAQARRVVGGDHGCRGVMRR